MPDLAGKIVLITGAASGIGEATAEAAARAGATVVLADVTEAAGQQVAARLGPPHRFVRLDVSDPAAWQAALPPLMRELGGLDFVFLNAGVMTRPPGEKLFDHPIRWLNPDSFKKIVGVNLGGVVFGILACLDHLKGRPDAMILVTSSPVGVEPFPNDPFYSMTKHGLVGLSTSLAPILEADGIRIAALCPKGTLTAMVPQDMRERYLASGAFGPPSHTAEAVLQVYSRARPGEIWVSPYDRAPYRYRPNPLGPPPADGPGD